jgi:hypothetical protein
MAGASSTPGRLSTSGATSAGSPNGLNLLASDSEKVAHNLHFFFGGERLTWLQVVDFVRAEWSL